MFTELINVKYEYSRSGNLSRHALEKCLADLDNGSAAFAYASGLAALGAVLQLLEVGDHIVAFDDLYGGLIDLSVCSLSSRKWKVLPQNRSQVWTGVLLR